MTLASGAFVRVRDRHPYGGMTGTITLVEGGDVYVELTAWGSERVFSRFDLQPAESTRRTWPQGEQPARKDAA